MMGNGLTFARRRRFSNNTVFCHQESEQVYFCKLVHSSVDADAEVAGYDWVKDIYVVPRRYRVSRDRRGRTLICYDYVHTIDTNRGLLADLLNQEHSGQLDAVRQYADELGTAYRKVAQSTGMLLTKENIRTKLFEDRIRPGGRIDCYYSCLNASASGKESLSLIDLASRGVVVNGALHVFGIQTWIDKLRDYFLGADECVAALTQGDPTELNLGFPLIWLDFDNAGYNSLLGEWATFAWYIYLLGGYLVPKYDSRLFVDHDVVFSQLTRNAPNVRSLRVRDGLLEIECDMSLPRPRQLLISRYRDTFIRPIVEEFNMPNWQTEIRYYVALRILGVFNIFDLAREDTAFLISKLIDCVDEPFFSFDKFFGLEEK